MIRLSAEQTAAIREWFLPERPGPLIGLHVIQTGHGACFADRWPKPRAVLVETAGNYSLSGEASALTAADLQSLVRGFVETSPGFIPLLKAAFPDVREWDRVILEGGAVPSLESPPGAEIRRLEPADEYHLLGLSDDSAWITKTWGGPSGLSSSGRALPRYPSPGL